MWGEANPDEVRAVWGERLAEFEAGDLRAALEACRFSYKDYPPTLWQFLDLCTDARRRRTQDQRALPAPKTPPDPRVMAEVHRLADRMRVPRRVKDRE